MYLLLVLLGHIMKILIVQNVIFQYIKLEGMDDKKIEDKSKEKIECIRCGSKMEELSVCHLRCFKCGAELTCSDKGNYW